MLRVGDMSVFYTLSNEHTDSMFLDVQRILKVFWFESKQDLNRSIVLFFMFTQMAKQGEKVSTQQIENLELFLKTQLPTDYKKFLLSYNGGRPNEKSISFNSDKIDGGGVHEHHASWAEC